MHRSQLFEALYESLEKQGFRGKIISMAHLKELQNEIETLRKKGLLDKELYDAYLASFDFECQHTFSEAQSVIIVSVPQPQVRTIFALADISYPVIIPPTYSFSADNQVADFLEAQLGPQGYRLRKVRLPDKLLAVRSGLAKYGKNNITYVRGSGSFHRPVVFISDVPCETDNWEEPTVLEQCENCSACMKACPTDAIGSDRFLLHAERCLAFHNERSNDFPQWLSPAWHNSLVGCMICQKVCPANKDVRKWTESAATFNPEETALILDGASDDQLPRGTLEKLKKLDMMEYYDVLGRNLKVLIKQQHIKKV
ncbi:MAG: 4Fe-4S double cluster binding domain-containing protein [Desulfobacterales bacterium]|jgi:epoxyqueuosine reductase